jgi:rhodanese-related sulfurtransferase
MKRKNILLNSSCCLATLMIAVCPQSSVAQSSVSIHQATLMESDQKTKEVSTEELRRILKEKSATVLDARPFKEYAISHIPGAANVSAKPGVPMSLYVSDVAEIGRLLKGDKAAPIVLYCNGPFCGKSKRLAGELLLAGYTNVRRYQLGIPVWRALGEVTQIEPAGIRTVAENDRTAVFIDTREADNFKAGSISGAKNIPRSLVKEGKDVGEVKAAKDDGRLPMEDHNTRVIVFGQTSAEAKAVAEAIAKEAFHNVSFFEGGFQQFESALKQTSSVSREDLFKLAICALEGKGD